MKTAHYLNSLLNIISKEFSAQNYNEKCFMHIMNQQNILSLDESSLHILVLHFSDYKTIEGQAYYALEAAEYLQKISAEVLLILISEHIKCHSDAQITKSCNGPQITITGYQYDEQPSHFASILCTEATLYITIQIYPQ